MSYPIDFSTITACGECCTGCVKKQQGLCKGCLETEGGCEEWTQSGGCPIFRCTREHNVLFCGLCEGFPCQWLIEKMVWRPNAVQELTELAQCYREAGKKGC